MSFFSKINKDCAFLISTGKEFESEHHKPRSDEEIPPMTIPWMQNEDFGSVDGPVEDHRSINQVGFKKPKLCP